MSEFFFFFEQKTAYELRISDWSSDVCSSDLSGSGFSRSGLRGGLLLRRFLRETQVAQARHPLIALALRLFLLLDDLVVFLVAGGEVLLGPRLVRLPHVGIPSFLDRSRAKLAAPRSAPRRIQRPLGIPLPDLSAGRFSRPETSTAPKLTWGRCRFGQSMTEMFSADDLPFFPGCSS